MKIEGKKTFTPVTITLETEEEFTSFWDGIELVCQYQRESMQATFKNPEYKILVDVSNAFTEL